MTLDRVMTFAKKMLTERIISGDCVVDGTMGNGHDTAFLAGLVGEQGRVLAFDVQDQAVENTTTRLKELGLLERVNCILDGHENVATYLSAYEDKPLRAAMFNLGYLPGGDKSVVTTPHTTIKAIDVLCERIERKGVIALIVYHGHEEGKIERDAVVSHVTQLNQKEFDVAKYEFINQVNDPPFLLLISKK